LNAIDRLLTDPRITVRCDGPLNAEGRAVVYWMQCAQRGVDNPALDVAACINRVDEMS
jgi:deoxyribodipyrimidine photo-lyase